MTSSSLVKKPGLQLSRTVTSSLVSMVMLNETQLGIVGVNDESGSGMMLIQI